MAPPKQEHEVTQRRLRRLLEPEAGAAGVIETEVGYRPVAEHEYWVADVIFMSRDRWESIPEDGYLEAPPELVIEVLSASNTAAEMRAKKKLCLENGSKQFWVVDRIHREVEVSNPDGRSVTYGSGQQIPLFFARGASISVDAIFS